MKQKHRQPVFEYKQQPVNQKPQMKAQPRPAPPQKPAKQAVNLPSQPKVKPDPFPALAGANLTMQSRGGLVYQGTYRGLLKGFFRLEPATVIGSNQAVNVPWVLVDRSAIAHLHPIGTMDNESKAQP
ncbi:MAG: hypothetical protein WCA08_12175 [Desulfoferrobacter sp.]